MFRFSKHAVKIKVGVSITLTIIMIYTRFLWKVYIPGL